MARSDYAAMILGWIGSADFKILDEGNGWPSIVEWKRDGHPIRLALHISQAGDYYRKPYEWRFQNPAGGNQPVDDAGGFMADGDPFLANDPELLGQTRLKVARPRWSSPARSRQPRRRRMNSSETSGNVCVRILPGFFTSAMPPAAGNESSN